MGLERWIPLPRVESRIEEPGSFPTKVIDTMIDFGRGVYSGALIPMTTLAMERYEQKYYPGVTPRYHYEAYSKGWAIGSTGAFVGLPAVCASLLRDASEASLTGLGGIVVVALGSRLYEGIVNRKGLLKK